MLEHVVRIVVNVREEVNNIINFLGLCSRPVIYFILIIYFITA